MNEFVGGVDVPGRYALVAGQFNRSITDMLVEGAVETLVTNGVAEDSVDCFWVPGAFEIPLIAKQLAMTNKYMAIITLGAVIRGETAHFDYVCAECARGVTDISLQHNMPVLFGVLTTNTVEQAVHRAKMTAANKGGDVAMAALNMVSLMKKI